MTSSALVTSTAPDSLADRMDEVSRNTAETRIGVGVNLDGTGQASLSTGIGFFDHMLDQIARHGLIDLNIQCEGCLLYTSPSPRDRTRSRMPSSA